MTDAPNARLVIVLPAALREQVSKLAEQDAVSLSAISRRAIKKYVQECTSGTKRPAS